MNTNDPRIKAHAEWLAGAGGEQLVMRYSDLSNSDMRGSDLSYSDLRYSDLRYSDLRYSDMSYSDMRGSDLSNSDMRGSDMRGSDMRDSDMRGSDMRGSNLSGASIDFAAWPLWCGSLGVKVDGRIARQLLYHALDAALGCDDDDLKAAISKKLLKQVNKSHVVTQHGQMPLVKEDS